MKRIILTGAGGLVGRTLLEQATQKHDLQVIAVTSQPDLVHRICQRAACMTYEEVLEGCGFDAADVLIHCGFARSNETAQLRQSIAFTETLFQRAEKHPQLAVINISSRSVYGALPTPWKESMQPQPDGAYAAAKWETELLAARLSNQHTSIRLGALISPELPDRVCNKLIACAAAGNALRIVGGKQQFAYMDVRDAANGILSFIGAELPAWEPIYNLGNEEPLSIMELAKLIAEVIYEEQHIQVPIRFVPSDTELHDGMDCTRFHNAIGWMPKIDMKEAFKHIYHALSIG